MSFIGREAKCHEEVILKTYCLRRNQGALVISLPRSQWGPIKFDVKN